MKSLFTSAALVLVFVFGLLAANTSAIAQNAPPTATSSDKQSAGDKEKESDPIKMLLKEVDRVHAQLIALRQELAQAQLERNKVQHELDVLKQFISDNKQFGQDFAQYKAVKDIAEREVKQRKQDEARRKRDEEQNQRAQRRREIKAQREISKAEKNRLNDYRRAGFSPVGLDVFVGKMAFYYGSDDTTTYNVRYYPYIRRYNYGQYNRGKQLDFSSMTISGSVVNAADVTRNLGIAITFFDEDGNQVGSETVQINNARPNVPYPFTSKLAMALNRAFDSSTTYVLYADPIINDEAPKTPPIP